MRWAARLFGVVVTVFSFGQISTATAQVEGFFNGVGSAITYCLLTQSCSNGSGSQRSAPRGTTTQRAPAQRPQASPTVMADQSALNYFGFPAGTADGLSGRQTRTAISNYQNYMGYPSTGELTDSERSILQTSYQRAMSGAASQYPNLVQSEGVRGLLRGFQREAQGLPVDPNAVRPQPAAPAAVAAAPSTAPSAAPAAVPSFFKRPTTVSINQFCSEINILTTANGRMVDKNSITDSQFALDEQFCAARGYAISRGQQLAAELQGLSDADLQAQCEGLIGVLAPRVEKLGTESPGAFAAAAEVFVRDFGLGKEQLISTGEVCLGLGYRTDNSDLVLASTAVLVGAGSAPFGELFGHHLRKGFGVVANDDAAQAWFDSSLTALEAGDTAVFLPTQSAQRVELLRKALAT